jgi:hypothetical protein
MISELPNGDRSATPVVGVAVAVGSFYFSRPS